MIESIYFSCYYAFLLGDLNKTRMYFDILRDEFKAGGSIESLNKGQLEQLAIIRDSLKTGHLEKREWVESTGSLPDNESPSPVRQDELVRNIHETGEGQLREIFQQDQLELYNIEHPCPPYGIVDMVYMGNRTVYPVEVKKDQGGHDLIGQIGKYGLFHKLKVHYKLYDRVRSATVCRSYKPYVLDELKKMGVITILYSGEKEALKLKRV